VFMSNVYWNAASGDIVWYIWAQGIHRVIGLKEEEEEKEQFLYLMFDGAVSQAIWSLLSIREITLVLIWTQLSPGEMYRVLASNKIC
jgi:hypothetical protein